MSQTRDELTERTELFRVNELLLGLLEDAIGFFEFGMAVLKLE